MHRVLVTGGRGLGNKAMVHDALNRLRAVLGDFAIIEGGASGADGLARDWAKYEGLPCATVNAAWFKLGKQAGSIRNSWMLDIFQPTYAVAFPGGFGTQDMVTKLQAAGITVWDLRSLE